MSSGPCSHSSAAALQVQGGHHSIAGKSEFSRRSNRRTSRSPVSGLARNVFKSIENRAVPTTDSRCRGRRRMVSIYLLDRGNAVGRARHGLRCACARGVRQARPAVRRHRAHIGNDEIQQESCRTRIDPDTSCASWPWRLAIYAWTVMDAFSLNVLIEKCKQRTAQDVDQMHSQSKASRADDRRPKIAACSPTQRTGQRWRHRAERVRCNEIVLCSLELPTDPQRMGDGRIPHHIG
jgi:hypothetical protein